MRRCTSAAVCGPTSCSTARRAISWRNRSTGAVGDQQTGGDRLVERAAVSAPVTAASRSGSTRSPTRAAASSTSRPAADNRAARASTASRADAGSWSRSPRSTSLTKNGLPPVSACTAAASWPVAALRAVTAARGQGRQVDAPRGALRRDVAQGLAQGAVLGEAVVAVGGHHHGPDRAQAAGDVADQVEGRLVGEVEVLHDEHGEAPGHVLAQHRRAARRNGRRGVRRRRRRPARRRPTGRRRPGAARGRTG